MAADCDRPSSKSLVGGEWLSRPTCCASESELRRSPLSVFLRACLSASLPLSISLVVVVVVVGQAFAKLGECLFWFKLEKQAGELYLQGMKAGTFHCIDQCRGGWKQTNMRQVST